MIQLLNDRYNVSLSVMMSCYLAINCDTASMLMRDVLM